MGSLHGVSLFYSILKLQELKANPHRNARGTVIEAGLEKSKGPMATFIVQNGTLKKGDVVVCGEAFGKVSDQHYPRVCAVKIFPSAPCSDE